ncbi:MAG: lactonase family protein [Planctomycetota bacterium]
MIHDQNHRSLRAFAAGLLVTTALTAQGLSTVYTITNATDRNEVAVGLALPSGRVLPVANVPTGGTGTAAGLGSQGALTASPDGRWIVAVNPGSDDITLFRSFAGLFLWRTDTASSGGDRPTSVALHGDLVYALNADSDSVTGFRVRNGRLQPIGTTALSGTGVAAAQVGFDPDGRWLVVTERATNRIDVFPVRRDGSLGPIVVNDSAGSTPFGYLFRQDGTIVVSEAAGGQPNASVTSSYRIRGNGTLDVLTAALPTDQTAACWIAIPRGGEFAYTTNTASGTLTGYSIDRRGRLMRLDASGATGQLEMGARPIDAEFERRGHVLFVLDSGNDEVVALRRQQDGSLRRVHGAWSLPDGAAGLIVR